MNAPECREARVVAIVPAPPSPAVPDPIVPPGKTDADEFGWNRRARRAAKAAARRAARKAG